MEKKLISPGSFWKNIEHEAHAERQGDSDVEFVFPIHNRNRRSDYRGLVELLYVINIFSMTIYEDTNSKPLLDLLDRIHSGDMVLPDFQRDFVWEPSATQALIVSIAKNYPAGSILRVRDRQRAFSSREFEGAPPPASEHTFLVLDGQQRLTSLYQAFYGVGDHRYYLNIRALIDGADFEDAIDYLRRTKGAVAKREAIEWQAEQLLMPLSTLHKGSTGFSKWASQVARTRQRAGATSWKISCRSWRPSGSTALINTSSQLSPCPPIPSQRLSARSSRR